MDKNIQDAVRAELKKEKRRRRRSRFFTFVVLVALAIIILPKVTSNKKQAKNEWTSKTVEDSVNQKAKDVERKIENLEKQLSVDDYVTTKAPENKVTEAVTVTETAPVTEAETEPEAAEAEPVLDLSQLSNIKEAIENGDYSLVTPEFKATMDEYEAFYDEYIAFTKKYTSGEGDYLSMLGDYMKMIERLSEWEDKIDNIDEDSLSAADQAYYLVVTARVLNKSLSALE
jgi:apolipoprotein N-acyltransferase